MSQRLLKFEYNVYVGAEDTSFDIYSRQFNQTRRRKLKKHLKKKIGDYIGSRVGSVGTSHLLKNQTPRKSTDKRFLLGENGGSISDRESEQYVYDLTVFTVVDSQDSNRTKELYNTLLEELNGYRFAFDMGILFDDLSSSKDRIFKIAVSEPEEPYEGTPHSNESGDALTSSISEEAYKNTDIVETIASKGRVTDPVEATEADDYEGMMKQYNNIDNQIEALCQDYEKESVEVRKPTENEVGRIVESIVERLEMMSESEDYLYFEDVPEFWEKAECSHCQRSDSDIYYLSREKIKSTLLTHMEEGFGITEDEESKRNQVSKKFSNFYVNSDGDVFFRPEEIISWIIDYIHDIEPYCIECHSDIGGSNHSKVVNRTDTKKIGTKKPDSNSSLETVEKDSKNIEKRDVLDSDSLIEFDTGTESINIQTDDINSEEWTVYRKPESSEVEDIMSRIIHHIYSLGTRGNINYKPQVDRMSRVTLKRGKTNHGESFESLRCKSCNELLDSVEKHHPNLLRLREAHMDIINSVDVPLEMNPILVNEEDNEYILSHQFLWRMESHIRNLEISAFKCSNCKTSEDGVQEENDYLQTTLSDTERNELMSDDRIEDEILNYTPDGSKINHRLQCPLCDSDEIIVCTKNDNGRYETQSGALTPVVHPRRINVQPEEIDAEYIGVCERHLNKLTILVQSKDIQNIEEVQEQIEESLRMMANKK